MRPRFLRCVVFCLSINYAAVHLELGLSRAAQSHASFSSSRAGAAALTLEVSPQTLQAGQHVAVLRQLHLCLCGCRLRSHCEYVENERCAVENLHSQFFFDVAYLFGRQFVVEYCHSDRPLGFFLILDVLFYFLQLSASHVGHGTRTVHSLGETLHGDGSRRVGEKLQLVKIFFCLGLVLVFGYESHKHCGLGRSRSLLQIIQILSFGIFVLGIGAGRTGMCRDIPAAAMCDKSYKDNIIWGKCKGFAANL